MLLSARSVLPLSTMSLDACRTPKRHLCRASDLRRAEDELVVRVHAQNADCGTADRRLADDGDTVPSKMVPPRITSRVEQLGDLVCFGINPRQIRAFTKIAVNAREGQIVGGIEATVFLGNNMLDVEGRKG